MTTLLAATHNKGKKKEIQEILADANVQVLSLDDIETKVPEPEETGATYEENALIKARSAGILSGIPTIADDSGLEVAALPRELGVYSARYASTDTERVSKLLHALEGKSDRAAVFVCCIVLYDPKTKTHQSFFGRVDGAIAEKPRGTDGFGYDPVFIPKGFTETFAELSGEKKNTLSHRARALEKLKKYLLK